MPVEEDKRTLRTALLIRKLRLSKKEVDKLSSSALEKLIRHVDWQTVRSVHTYLPIDENNELDTWPLINYIRKNHPKIKIYLPRLDGSALFEMDTPINENRLGIPEPEGPKIDSNISFDLVVVPIVGFDRRGFRLGYGNGYYDRFLTENNCKRVIGLAYGFSETKKIPDEPHDQKLHEIITEEEIITVS